VCGALGLFLGRASADTVTARTGVAALAITWEALRAFAASQPDAALRLMADVLRSVAPSDGEPTATPRPALAPAAKAAPAAPKSAAKAAPPHAETPVADEGSIFLPGHRGDYVLSVPHGGDLLYEKKHTCPQCNTEFKVWTIKASKLATEKTEHDMRVRYKGIEPLYYDVITCPKCWYSAIADNFASGMRRRTQLDALLAPWRAEIAFPTELEIDVWSVFAAHYLALACAPLTQPGPALVTSKLWYKLCRIYADCEDSALEMAAAQKAYDAYLEVYTKTHINPRQNQQLLVTLGELALKLGDLPRSRDYFFKAKLDRNGTPALRRHCEDRIEDLRTLAAEAAEK
jgi:hypothetical protein